MNEIETAYRITSKGAKQTYKGFFTSSEIVLIGLLNDGRKYNQMAVETNVSIGIINYMMKTIFSKLGVHTRKDACDKFYRKHLSIYGL